MRRPQSGDPTPVGVLGGTFDPVHDGHLQLADAVARLLRLSRVLLVPASIPPHKTDRAISSARHREAMLRIALADWPGLALCTLELDLGGVRYTVDTLRRLRAGSPPLAPVFVLGTDSLLELEQWRESRALVREFDLAALDRPGTELDHVRGRLAPFVAERLVELPAEGIAPDEWSPGRGGRVFHLPVEPIRISSRVIRLRAARGESLTGLVPPEVARYIHRTGIYRKESGP